MSYGIVIYEVDIGALHAACGSGDRDLVAAVSAGIDEPARTAVRHLILGEPCDAERAADYGFGLEAMCAHLGKRQRNAGSFPASPAFLAEVDDALVGSDLIEPAPLARLVYRGPPVALPSIDDFPSIGYLEADEVVVAYERFRGILRSELEPAVALVVQDLVSWMKQGTLSHRGLVGFYY